MPNKDDIHFFVFPPEKQDRTTFRSIDPPTVQLAFTDTGVIFRDHSQGIKIEKLT